jgi:membrane protein DedA with SNARE-associated domain
MDNLEQMPEFIQWIVHMVHHLGLPGIFFATFLESTFVPIPSEFTMIPAGYLVYQGKMNLIAVMALSIVGTITGSLVNYYIARLLGRPIIVRFQKYFFMNDTKMYKIESFFNHHGEVSTLTGRLIPGLRHLISFPAGLARMDVRIFSFYTGIGGGIWMGALTAVGYFIGGKEHLVREWMPKVIAGGIILAILIIIGYVMYMRRISKADNANALKETLKELEPHHKHHLFKPPHHKEG